MQRNIGIRYESSTKTFSYDEADAGADSASAVTMSISDDVTMAGGQFTDLTERLSHRDLENDTDKNKQLEEDMQGSAD